MNVHWFRNKVVICFTVYLKDIGHDVMKKVIELLYFREINVPSEFKGKLMNALKFLKIDDILDPDMMEIHRQQGGKWFCLISVVGTICNDRKSFLFGMKMD